MWRSQSKATSEHKGVRAEGDAVVAHPKGSRLLSNGGWGGEVTVRSMTSTTVGGKTNAAMEARRGGRIHKKNTRSSQFSNTPWLPSSGVEHLLSVTTGDLVPLQVASRWDQAGGAKGRASRLRSGTSPEGHLMGSCFAKAALLRV